MSAANKRAEGSDSYALPIGSATVSFIIMLFAHVAWVLTWVSGLFDYRFWLNTASKLPFLSLLKFYPHRHANSGNQVAALPAAPPLEQTKGAIAPRLPKVKNTLYTPVHRQQALLGVQRA